jgi:hypothetical protein
MAAKTMMFGKLPIKFQFGVEKSIVRQDNMGKDWLFRFNIIPLFPQVDVTFTYHSIINPSLDRDNDHASAFSIRLRSTF